jgi:glyoxylase-like metal-dependent hydrolase (beta-lactamase superfamily II)
VNGALIERSGKQLAVYGDPRPEPAQVEQVLFTHHRRDVVWAGRRLVEQGAKAVVPAAEQNLFNGVQQFWQDYETSRFHDYGQQSSKILTEPLEVAESIRDGRTIHWEGLQFAVIDTPGYTRGAVSYLAEIDGERVAFVGDLIYGEGQIHDVFSLQDAIPEANTRGYHGYAARAADVIQSLRKVAEWKPTVLVPSRGPLIYDAGKAIALLTQRLQGLLMAYYQTDALRWYWGDDNLKTRARRVLGDQPIDWMPMATQLRQSAPAWMHKFGTARLLVSNTGSAFLIDCGSEETMQSVRDLYQRGVFKKLDGIFITHYHDDHTDKVQEMRQEFRCPVYSGPEVKDILENPQAYRMPAVTPNPIRPVEALQEDGKLRWNEFEFTYKYFPGQAIYHGGLLAKHDSGETFFFIGDSFSPSGLDDYCILNRHFLHPDRGHFLCLSLIQSLQFPYLLVNQHIEPTFRYSPEQLTFMIEKLNRKKAVLSEMVPWDDPNYGMDEQWVRLYPYWQQAKAGQPFELQAIVFNHSAAAREFRVTPRLPKGWQATSESVVVSVPPRTEARGVIAVTPPPDAKGLTVLTADVSFADKDLREWVEAMVRFEN